MNRTAFVRVYHTAEGPWEASTDNPWPHGGGWRVRAQGNTRQEAIDNLVQALKDRALPNTETVSW